MPGDTSYKPLTQLEPVLHLLISKCLVCYHHFIPSHVNPVITIYHVYSLSGPPDIILPPEDEFLIDGSTAMFYCAALAFPPHYVEWSFNNTDGDSAVIIRTNGMDTTKYQIDSGSAPIAFGTLIILNVEYKDRGQYMCRAINDIGSDSAVANLTVHGTWIHNANTHITILFEVYTHKV